MQNEIKIITKEELENAAGAKRCPVCGNLYILPSATSRRDNKTEICPDCGEQEALAWYQGSENEK